MRTRVEVTYQGVNITQDIAPYLLSFTWTDNESKKADELRLQLQDADGRWHSDWYPSQGDQVSARIVIDSERAIECGTFWVDELSWGGPPSVVDLRASSVPLGGDLKKQRKTRAWEDITLTDIARRIASENGLAVLTDFTDDVLITRVDQTRETDLGFLARICEEDGLNLKVTDGQIVVYGAQKFDDKPPAYVIEYKGGLYTNWSFSTQSFTEYKSAVVKWFDTKSGRLKEKRFGSGAPELTVQRQFSSLAEAERFAKSALRRKNEKNTSVTLEMVGNVNLVAGLVVELTGWGAFSGRYSIESATHSVSGSGYKTSVSLRKVIRGY